MGDFDNKEREEVFSKKVRAGKRTYFFDVKATRSNDYYVTVTESKKRLEDGVFIKHKIFLYKEDFEKFAEGLKETIDYIKANQEVVEKRYEYSENHTEQAKTDDDFSFAAPPPPTFARPFPSCAEALAAAASPRWCRMVLICAISRRTRLNSAVFSS